MVVENVEKILDSLRMARDTSKNREKFTCARLFIVIFSIAFARDASETIACNKDVLMAIKAEERVANVAL